MTKDQFKIVTITAIGGALEFYDFTIYALFAPYISRHFFANTNQVIALVNTFAIFALGYLSRPLGGIIFGHCGDKYGRKSAFSLAIFMMATSTLFMGLLPGYQSIGIIAPILLMLFRLIQGFSVGGEIPGASIFIIEHVPKERRGLAIGLVFSCITLGNTMGALVGLGLTHWLSAEQMNAWGWRIPFIIGFILGIVSYVIRQKTFETPVFLAMKTEGGLYPTPFFELVKSSRKKIFNAFLLTASTSSIISFLLYVPTYFSTIININVSYAYLLNIIGFLCFAVMTAVFGYISDYVNRKKLLMTGAFLLIISCYPLFYGLTVFGGWFIWIFTLGFAVFGGMINGNYVVLITESFPANLRYSGVGLSYSLGVAVFGGLAPLIFTGLIHFFASAEAPAIYLSVAALLTFMAAITSSDLKEGRI